MASVTPKLVLLVNPNREGHGLITALKAEADVVKPLRDDAMDAVFSFGVRSLAVKVISLSELRRNPQRVIDSLNEFQHKSQLPYAVLIAEENRRVTPPEFFKLETQVTPGRLKLLLAKDVRDAARAIMSTVGNARDHTKRVHASTYFAQLSQKNKSAEAIMGILTGLCAHLQLDEKEIWRVLSMYDKVSQMSIASSDDLTTTTAIEPASASILSDFLDARPQHHA